MPQLREQCAPIEVRRERVGAFERHRMVDGDGVALFDVGHRCRRQARLQRHDGLGIRALRPPAYRPAVRTCVPRAGDRPRARPRSRLALKIVIAVRQPEAALARDRDDLRAVLEILHLADLQRRIDADLLQMRELGRQFDRTC